MNAAGYVVPAVLRGAMFVPGQGAGRREPARVTAGAPEVLVGLRPECFLAAGDKGGLLQGEVEVIEQLGAESYLYLRIRGLDVVEHNDRPGELAGAICARLNDPVEIKTGEPMSLGLRPELVRLFDEKTGISRLG